MIKNKIFAVCFALLSVAIFSSYSSGPPGDYTGSPASDFGGGVSTCSSSQNGCHAGGTVNGSLTLSSNIGAAYVSGQTYQITVALTDPDMVQGGFQLSAIDNANIGTGTFTPIANTALLNGAGDPTIINHSSPLVSSPTATWIFNWTAPSSGSAPVSFYCSAVAGNGGGSSGDAVYTATSLNIPLPIEIIDFSVKNVENKALLAWKTGAYNNFAHFEIEKSTDGKHFVSVGKVDLANNNNGDYTFTDAENLSADLCFYRLKTIDFDKRFSYSKIVSFKNTTKKDFVIYPTIAQNTLSFRSDIVFEKAIVIDFLGHVYSFEIDDNQLNISALQNGNYTISLDGNTWKRFSVLR
jgi:Reeler domain